MLFSLLVISSTTTLTSCLGFFEEEVLQISSIQTIELENGDIQVFIIYSDEEIAPTTFVVPKGDAGEDGKDGNGIKEISYELSEDKQNTILNIEFTQQGVNPEKIIIPNGVSVTNIEQSFDEETQMTTLYVNFSDGSKSEPILIPRGEKGEDGISVIGIDQRVNRDMSVTLTFNLSQGEPVIVDIPAPQKGEDGRGIKDIVSVPNGDSYTMKITFTDDTTQELEFARPNKWFSEMSKPTKDDGIDGDLWYDTAHQIIYLKQNGRWVETMNFNDTVEEIIPYTVSFNLNDSNEEPASMPVGTLLEYEIDPNMNFYSSGYEVPQPTREGYEFEGWYTTKIVSSVHGTFTDLTYVMSNMTLYAKWSKTND
jgi:uncharacterized repeat protein (TIGR02543 family)